MRDTKWEELDRPLNEDERAWLSVREKFDVIAANDQKFDTMDEDQDEDDAEVPAPAPNYDSWKSDELKAEVKKRQEAGREVDITGMTKKSQVAEALRADDAAKAAEADAE